MSKGDRGEERAVMKNGVDRTREESRGAGVERKGERERESRTRG